MDQFLNCTPEQYQINKIHYQNILEDEENWKHVPMINHAMLQNIKDSSLVRFRGMIQDMLDPEIYLEKYEVMSKDKNEILRIQEGKYRDCLVLSHEENVNYDSTNNVHGERRTFFLVSIPGLNEWAIEIEKKNLGSNNIYQKNETTENEYHGGIKRSYAEEQPMDVDALSTESSASNKRSKENDIKAINNASISGNLSYEYLVNSPIAHRPGKACMVKIYSDIENYTLNTLVDVIGFLSVDPALDGSTMERDENDFEDISEVQAANPPPSLIPRIHAIVVKKLLHTNPLLEKSITSLNSNEELNIESAHKDLKIVLTQCLFGDELVAEYLISHLISTIYVRTDFETLGKFTLNICNIPNGVFEKYTEQLYSIIENVLPSSHYLPMTLENLNMKQFTPVKDYTTNKLTSGLLQLAPHTHLVLDETKLEPGKLEASGVKAVQSIAAVIKNQQIKYDFKYYDLEFNTDIPVLVFSDGRSMLPSNFQIPLNCDPELIPLIEETFKAAKHFLQTKLNTIRQYLTQAKLADFKLNREDSEIIENDFVEMRKADPKTDAELLHRHLILSRYLGIARGKKYFDKEIWQLSKEFEKERKIRLNNLPKSKGTKN